jgi:NhaP-type Na+/H+ or K+/H+ antiporter
METGTILILLFVVVTAVAIVVQRLAVPYTLALVIAGLVLGLLQAFEAPHLTKSLMFNVFLPGLLFEAAFYIEFRQFWRNRLTINSLALPGVVAAIAAYGSFLAAEHFHYSGVIATVSAGMLCGNNGASVGMSPSTRIAVESFWEYVAFALNPVVFLLIGLEVNFQALLASWQAILVAYLVVTGGRAMIIFGASSLLRKTRERIPWAWSAVLTWDGLRGGLSMVLVLSLPIRRCLPISAANMS